MRIPVAVVLLLDLLDIVWGNHLKDRQPCENSHVDITTQAGVGIEAMASSQISVKGLKFPQLSFAAGDRISMEFRTTALNGLIFHGEDNQKRHELSAWIHNGEVRLRLIGHCHWLYLRDLAYDSYNVSDGRFHRLTVMVKQSGISFTIDHRDERTFFYAANPVFRCWHLQNIYFALPSPSKSREDNPSQPELSMKMDGCIRNLQTSNTNDTEAIRTTYKRVSSCNQL